MESEASVMVVVGGAQGWEGDDWGLGAGLGWARFSLPLASRWLAVGTPDLVNRASLALAADEALLRKSVAKLVGDAAHVSVELQRASAV